MQESTRKSTENPEKASKVISVVQGHIPSPLPKTITQEKHLASPIRVLIYSRVQTTHAYTHATTLSTRLMNKINATTNKINSCMQILWLSPSKSNDAKLQESLDLKVGNYLGLPPKLTCSAKLLGHFPSNVQRILVMNCTAHKMSLQTFLVK